jgi:hypothetical protein
MVEGGRKEEGESTPWWEGMAEGKGEGEGEWWEGVADDVSWEEGKIEAKDLAADGRRRKAPVAAWGDEQHAWERSEEVVIGGHKEWVCKDCGEVCRTLTDMIKHRAATHERLVTLDLKYDLPDECPF